MDNSRRTSRRAEARRKEERRIINSEFGSPEWLAMIQELYFSWPKRDQRVHARRERERRALERRHGKAFSEKQATELLSDEERQMLSKIWTIS